MRALRLLPRSRTLNTILVTRKLPAAVLKKLDSVGEVDLYAGESPIDPGELCARVQGKQAIVSMLTEQIGRSVLDAGRELKIVANVAVGYNNIDVDYARSKGVIVTNTPDVLTESVADYTWALILSITRRVVEGDRVVRRGAWKGWTFDFMLGADLRGKLLGLVGLGRIGRVVASRAPAFGMHVAYASRQQSDARSMPGLELEHVSLDQLLCSADVISIHVPLSPETRHLIDKRALARMKRSAYLVNTARGPIVDEDALAWALEQRLIAGAALDVYENEPAIHPQLLTLDNVVLAPHLGSGTIETRTAMADLAVRNVVEVLSERRPLTPVLA
ncbi:MAG: D-glycerate dehydrogenase [Acidobacteria bacterium]|nr:MAG: D-glycerate dehydrogenase [Acidobacteriota bacterium]